MMVSFTKCTNPPFEGSSCGPWRLEIDFENQSVLASSFYSSDGMVRVSRISHQFVLPSSGKLPSLLRALTILKQNKVYDSFNTPTVWIINAGLHYNLQFTDLLESRRLYRRDIRGLLTWITINTKGVHYWRETTSTGSVKDLPDTATLSTRFKFEFFSMEASLDLNEIVKEELKAFPSVGVIPIFYPTTIRAVPQYFPNDIRHFNANAIYAFFTIFAYVLCQT